MYPTNVSVSAPHQNVLLIIDPQVDFHTGSLKVPGATEDAMRIAAFLNDNRTIIGELFITLDSHHKRHIAHKAFWSSVPNDCDGSKGKPPSDFEEIKHKDILTKKWNPRDCALQEHCEYYSKKLEEGGQFFLTIWPDHCLIGSYGHTVQETIQQAVRDWDVHHYKKNVHHIHKGMNCLTEMYSAVRAEVEIETDPTTTKNEELLAELRKSGKLVICGQALSHCVNFTARHIVEDWKLHTSNRVRMGDIILLEDGASPVPNCEPAGIDFIKFMKDSGCTVIKCAEAAQLLNRNI